MPGVATGLALTPVGGEVLFIEATAMPGGQRVPVHRLAGPGDAGVGACGAVLRALRRAANSGSRLGSGRRHDIHLHIPAGAQPKDGPSAGVTIATALASLATGRPVRRDVGMTGEITLRGQVLPIGGVKEKVLAAHRAGLQTVILPKRNEPDLEDVPEDVRTIWGSSSPRTCVRCARRPALTGATRKEEQRAPRAPIAGCETSPGKRPLDHGEGPDRR